MPLITSQDKLNELVKKSLETNELDPNARLAFIADFDEQGIKTVMQVRLTKEESRVKAYFAGIYQHDWNGDDSIAGKVVFQVK